MNKLISENADILCVQFSCRLWGEDTDYTKQIFSTKGYQKPEDFWEIPIWITVLAHNLPVDVYIVDDEKELLEFLSKSNYKTVAFSVLEINKHKVLNVVQNYKGEIALGGYIDFSDFLKFSNVKVYESIDAFVGNSEFKWGTDYRHFKGYKTIPRLSLSDGCKHRCKFCCVPKGVKEKSLEEVDQQVESFRNLDFSLVYLNDKTFGQAKNRVWLSRIADKIREYNPNFFGFIIQTTATQLLAIEPSIMQHVRYCELGIESFNDGILRDMNKPTTESLIETAMSMLRLYGTKCIPNIIIGFPQENEKTYRRTLEFLKRSSDIISHVNTYTLTLYKDTDLIKEIHCEESDFDENSPYKSFHKDHRLHDWFSKKVQAINSKNS